jgi:multidrug efflux pump subunit AcrA (membrane-fusion protein)
LVPSKALRFYTTDENGEVKRYKDKGVWVLEKGQLRRVDVTTGVSDDDNIEIVSDQIKVGDEVVLEDGNAEVNKSSMPMRMPR